MFGRHEGLKQENTGCKKFRVEGLDGLLQVGLVLGQQPLVVGLVHHLDADLAADHVWYHDLSYQLLLQHSILPYYYHMPTLLNFP